MFYSISSDEVDVNPFGALTISFEMDLGSSYGKHSIISLNDPKYLGRSLPTLVVAGVSIALVLLCILIVAIFWYAWKKSQEGSIELNPIPYGEAGVSLQSVSVPENQQEWPFERAGQ
ncbi:hypothetical protein EK904_000723 [Melospiza melodia maxima]|nr:hypothetical protein EK904_000723 [Melospiza melodia maxima]